MAEAKIELMDHAAYMRDSISRYIGYLEEGHRLHRKIKFLLDIRGLLIINKIKGDYVEFGVYRGEMMFAASRVLAPNISRFIGLDTFGGLPQPHDGDEDIFVFKSEGFMTAPRELAEEMMVDADSHFIEGDFRDEGVQERLRELNPRISVLSIDCNWPSSVKKALHAGAPYLHHGSIVFLDDYFAGVHHRNFHDEVLAEIAEQENFLVVEFATYPPSARAFILEKK